MKLENWQLQTAQADKTMWRMSWKTRKLWPVLPKDQHAGSIMEVDRPKGEDGKVDYSAPGVCANCGKETVQHDLEASLVILNKYRLGWLVDRDCARKERAIRHSINAKNRRKPA